MAKGFAHRCFYLLKAVKRCVLASILIFLTSSLSAQDGELVKLEESNLVGIWQLDFSKSRKTTSKEMDGQLKKMNAQQLKKVNDQLIDLKYHFKSDHYVDIIRADGKTSVSNWELGDNGGSIILTDESGLVRKYYVIELKNKKLVLKMDLEGKYKPVLPELFLNRLSN
ncbi:lipocalin family protein [Roseivirga sp.]|uniref:lipocalin family protein n=1 Tax=Roseivirga sp. TaxID=1964215 RepID=UPI003B51D273